ncbi:MAG TPA: IS200/IS605 family element transposase accessory protein TnpB [Clostridiaceae bacterium]|nr:IS200/IS605 family element transposase accessory protein TnpB [Clostridiaceae bacterium]
MLKTYQYRLYPNKTQEAQMNSYLALSCRVYNALLEFLQEEYEQHGKSYSKFDKVSLVDQWRRENKCLQVLSSAMNRDIAHRVHLAYDAFFRRVKAGEKPGFPKFKKARYYRSFGVRQWGNCKILKDGQNGKIRLWDLGEVRCWFHRPLEGKLKTWTVRKTPTNKWYISFCVEVAEQKTAETGKAVGIDMGISSFIATSDGELMGQVDVLRQNLAELKRLQRAVSRKKKGSSRRKEAVLQVARLHERVANQRSWIHHNVARSLLERYDLVVVEDLQIKNMMKNHHLALSISDAAWGNFINILSAKADEMGKIVYKVNPRNTSQECSQCGVVVAKTLSDRVHDCPECGLVIDRDVNAAVNILQRGLIGEEKLSA